MQTLSFVLSIVLTLIFFIYGFNHYFLLSSTRKYRKPVIPDDPVNRPKVSIHLPVFNERYVIRRLVDACVAMARVYGVDNVSIKILDDSNDDTALEIDAIVAEYQAQSIHIQACRREKRTGFKAGALQSALEQTEEEFIAIFDADFIPPADFLLRTVPYFAVDPPLGIVQSRWTHLNREYNPVTRAIAVGIDVHFLVEQTGRYAAGCFLNFNGSAGVLRKQAVIDAGGWQGDTLAEDLDLSYRLQEKGYRVLFLREVRCPGEVPPTVPSFKKQQGRWANGSLRAAKKILPKLLPDLDIPFKKRLEAFIHLTGYMLHPLMLLSFLLICGTTLLGIKGAGISSESPALIQGTLGYSVGVIVKYLIWDMLEVAIILCAMAPWVSMLVTLKSQKMSIWRNSLTLVITFLLGFGISLSNSIEAGKALLTNKTWDFVRTPKYAEVHGEHDRKQKKYQVPLDFTWVLEFLLIGLGVVSIGISIHDRNYVSLVTLIPYTAAFLFVFTLTMFQSRQPRIA